MRGPNRTTVLLVLASLFVGALAYAQSPKFYKKYKGQLFVSDQEFQVSEDDAAMAAQVKNAKKELQGHASGEDNQAWDFAYLAVLSKKPGTQNATIFFYEGTGKTRKQTTYKDINIDASQLIIVSTLSMSEDDGLKKGTKYEIVLAIQDGKKQTVLAKGMATFK